MLVNSLSEAIEYAATGARVNMGVTVLPRDFQREFDRKADRAELARTAMASGDVRRAESLLNGVGVYVFNPEYAARNLEGR